MGTEAIHEEVNGAVHNAVQLMEHLGATVLRYCYATPHHLDHRFRHGQLRIPRGV